MHLIVSDENDGASRSPDGVGERALEESVEALLLEDLCPAVKGGGVHDLLLSCLHHHAATNSVEGI